MSLYVLVFVLTMQPILPPQVHIYFNIKIPCVIGLHLLWASASGCCCKIINYLSNFVISMLYSGYILVDCNICQGTTDKKKKAFWHIINLHCPFLIDLEI